MYSQKFKELVDFIGKEKTLVVCSPRSGSMNLALSLKEFGIKTEHEKNFTAFQHNIDLEHQVEVSWLATPYVGFFEGKIIHLVRDPINSVNSILLGHNFDKHRTQNNLFIFNLYPELQDKKIPALERAYHFWYLWNKIPQNYTKNLFRIEDLMLEKGVNSYGAPPKIARPDNMPKAIKQLAREFGYTY